MSIWFEGSSEIKCSIQQVKNAFENLGEHFVGVVGHMPGMTSVELVEQGKDFVTIKTNEGLMKRTNITLLNLDKRVVLELDEEYQAGSKITAKSHFVHEFTTSDSLVMHHMVVSDVEASGLLGFFYRNLGSSNTGNAFLASYKAYFEEHIDEI